MTGFATADSGITLKSKACRRWLVTRTMLLVVAPVLGLMKMSRPEAMTHQVSVSRAQSEPLPMAGWFTMASSSARTMCVTIPRRTGTLTMLSGEYLT